MGKKVENPRNAVCVAMIRGSGRSKSKLAAGAGADSSGEIAGQKA